MATPSGRPPRPRRAGNGGREGSSGDGGKGKAGPARGPRRAPDDRSSSPEAPPSWGGVARRGANRLNDQGPDLRKGGTGERETSRPVAFEPERWERADDLRSEAREAAARGARSSGAGEGGRPGPARSRHRPPRPAGPGSAGEAAERELTAALGATRSARAARRLREAARAFERERFGEARTILRPLAEQAPGSPSVRELLGLTYYRLGRWKLAASELEAFASLTASAEQHPILMDCYRALGRWSRVDELWEELRQASPAADVVAEGRIVLAGSLADRGDIAGAITGLDKARSRPRRPKEHHLRMAYALGDLCERAGDVARARELFGWIAYHDPRFADAAERADALT